MALFKQLNGKDRYHDFSAREDVINYILRPDKTMSGCIGWVNVDMRNPAASMAQVAKFYGKENGIQLRHFVLSFCQEEVDDPDVANEIAQQIAYFISQEYQTIYAVHEDTDQLHVHFVYNPVSYLDGHRYYGTKTEYYRLINFIKTLLHHYEIHKLLEVSFKSGLDIQNNYE